MRAGVRRRLAGNRESAARLRCAFMFESPILAGAGGRPSRGICAQVAPMRVSAALRGGGRAPGGGWIEETAGV